MNDDLIYYIQHVIDHICSSNDVGIQMLLCSFRTAYYFSVFGFPDYLLSAVGLYSN